MSQLELKAVSKRFDDEAVLRNISLSFPDGRVSAIVGGSGCGKSTLLKLCNGLLEPSSGEVCAFGAPLDYRELPALRRRMGYAVQGTGLFPHMNAFQNMTLAAKVAGWSEAAMRERSSELFRMMHLDDSLLQRYPHELSGGQQQRVGLCRAMLLRPDVLLLDEPFAAIDPLTRADIHQQLLELLEAEPVTVVLVTHDMREAMLLACQIIVMEGGEVRVNESRDALHEQQPDLEPEALLQELMRGAQQ